MLRARPFPDTGNGGGAAVQREDPAAAARRLEAQVAEPASEVEHAAVDERQREGLERVQRDFARPRLVAELGLEEVDATVVRHRVS